jgi:hypothetical protein
MTQRRSLDGNTPRIASFRFCRQYFARKRRGTIISWHYTNEMIGFGPSRSRFSSPTPCWYFWHDMTGQSVILIYPWIAWLEPIKLASRFISSVLLQRTVKDAWLDS